MVDTNRGKPNQHYLQRSTISCFLGHSRRAWLTGFRLLPSVALCVAFVALSSVPAKTGSTYSQILSPDSDSHGSECGWTPTASEQAVCQQFKPCDDPSFRNLNRVDTTESITWVRVMFHILAEDDGSNPAATSDIVHAQMVQLNNDFLISGIQFTYDHRFVNSSWGRHHPANTWTQTLVVKDSFYVASDWQLNVIVTDIPVPGAQNPEFMDVLTNVGGVILTVASGWTMFTADLRRHTITHEFGHCFGLRHTYSGILEVNGGICSHGCSENLATGSTDLIGDFCADTEPELWWGNSTFAGAPVDVCSGLPWPATPNINFMNAANVGKSLFTFDQVARMKCYLEDIMSPWIAGVRIKADSVFGKYPMEVQFMGETNENITNWVWDYGDGGSDVVQNPAHTFASPGVHTIGLTADDADTSWTAVNRSFVAIHADTLIVNRSEVQFLGSMGQVDVTISARNYIPASEFVVPLTISGPLELTPLSVSVNGLRTSSGSATIIHSDLNAGKIVISVSLDDGYFPADTGGIFRIRFSVPTGNLDSNLISTQAFGEYEPRFTTPYGSYLADNLSGYVVRPNCCSGSTGNIDGDSNDIVDIADLTFLIDHLFINFPPLDCPIEGNVDGDMAGLIDIADLTFLIDHLFINFPPTAPCR